MTPRRAIAIALFVCAPLAAQWVKFRTSQGDIDVELAPVQAPRTVANFLNYVNRGAYDSSIFHRSVANFIIQGGGYQWRSTAPNLVEIAQDAAVRNEFSISNTRGTLAMAKLDSGRDTATNQWFFNLGDNSRNLNNQNGGFTVFGRIHSAASLEVMDKIAAVRTFNLGSPIDQIPLVDYTSGPVQERNLVLVNSITVSNPAVAANGVITASAFGGFPVAAPGSFIEIYGSTLGPNTARVWNTGDFNGGVAPTVLDGVTVTIAGVRAAVNFVSAGQVNVQVPAGVPTEGTADVVVTYRGATGAAAQLALRPLAPGLLAPAAPFKVGDKQYVVALRPAGGFVSSSAIGGVPGTPAVRGETLVFYGTGFGAVDPDSVAFAGQIAPAEPVRIRANVEFRFGGAASQPDFAGLVPGLVGVYQFNVKVPAGAPAGDAALEVLVNGTPIAQSLWIPVRAE